MKKKNESFKKHVQNLIQKKEELPLHKMDDEGRRKFIQNVGYFLAAMTVPSMVRLETMSSLSKKIFGNSLAFAQNANFETKPIVFKINMRAGYAYNQWLLGCFGDDAAMTSPVRNTPWLNTSNVSVATNNGLPVIFPPTSADVLSAYANGIQNFSSISSGGQHVPEFRVTHSAGRGEMSTWRAKTEIDSGSNPVITSPFAFGNSELVALRDVPADLQAYAPTVYTNIASIYNQFTPPQFLTNQGTNISENIRQNLFTVMGNKFKGDIEKSLYKKDLEVLKSANEQSFQILATNYAVALNPTHPDNAATMATLTNALPAQVRLICPVDLAQAVFVGMQACNLGVTPRIFDLIIETFDWHESLAAPSANFTMESRYRSARYLAVLLSNLFTAVNDEERWINTINGEVETVDAYFCSEFTRGPGITPTDDNADNYTNASLIISSDVNQTRFMPGSFGGGVGELFYPFWRYNATANTHHLAQFPDLYSEQQSMGHCAKLLGVNLADFGITSTTTIAGIPNIYTG